MAAPPDSLGFLIADVARLLRRAFQSHLGDGPLTFSQSRALVYLARRQGVRQVDLAEMLEVQPITLARLVDQLAEAGLVERRRDPSDRRVHRLHLTPRATPHLARIRAIAAAVRGEALRDFAPQEAAQAIASLQRMRDVLSTSPRTTRPPDREP